MWHKHDKDSNYAYIRLTDSNLRLATNPPKINSNLNKYNNNNNNNNNDTNNHHHHHHHHHHKSFFQTAFPTGKL